MDPDPDRIDQEAEPSFELQFTPEESEAINKFLYYQSKKIEDKTLFYKNLRLKQELKRLTEGDFKPEKEKQRPNKDKPLTVHLFPHSHMDTGWIKTVDEYFTGFQP